MTVKLKLERCFEARIPQPRGPRWCPGTTFARNVQPLLEQALQGQGQGRGVVIHAFTSYCAEHCHSLL